MNSWLKDLINFVYPPQCHVCSCKLGSDDRFVCRKCISELPRTGFHRMEMNPMEERVAGLFPFEKATGLFFYTKGSPLATLIQDMKYRSFPDIGVFLGNLAVKELFSTGFFSDIEYVVPVPMHWLKKARRGFNQSEKIAQGIAENTSLTFCNALRMTRMHKTQTKMSRTQRLKNTDNLFGIKKGPDLTGKGILLVDDVCTTGATISAASSTLTSFYPSIRLYILTIGVTT